jgi:RNA polymerase sigma-70 factor (ECF subfamily)
VSGGASDRELIARAGSGDQDAFARLVARHQVRVFGLAYRFTRDRQDAEELAQEIFLRAWRHARAFRGESAFSTWLYRLAVNVCLNHRQAKRSRPSPQPLAGDLAADGPSRETADLETAEREKRVKAALDSLPARQRMALVLASFEDKSYEEIAEAMQISLPAVESLLFRARRNLAGLLRPLRQRGEI